MNNIPQDQTIELDLIEIWRILKKSAKPLLILFLTATIGTGIITYFFIPKKYQSNVVFYIIDQNNSNSTLAMLNSQVSGMLGGAGSIGQISNTDLCSNVILARQFLENVLKAEKLPYKFKNIKKFKKLININVDKSNAITISVLWTNPRKAYKLAKRIFNNYQKYVDEQVNLSNHSQIIFVEKQYNLSKERVFKAEEALLAYQKTKGVLALPAQVSIAQSKYLDLENQKVQLEMDLQQTKEHLGMFDKLLSQQTPQVKEAIIDQIDLIIRDFKNKLYDLEFELALARNKYDKQHPAIKDLIFKRDEIIKKIDEEKKSIISGNLAFLSPDLLNSYLSDKLQIAGLEARQEVLEPYYKKYTSLLASLPDELLAYERVVREEKVAAQVYEMLTTQLEQAKIADAKDVNNVEIHVIDPPTIPDKKYSPSTIFNMVIAGIVALLLGGGLALSREFFGKSKEEYRSIFTA
jgi:uncharacterized protein involved in exopolysaccharide biosynthesis